MIDTKKIADAVRAIREAYAPLVRTNTVCDGLTAIIDELDPPAKPLLADAKVGDLCRLRNGGYTQIESVKRRSGKTWHDRTDRYTSYPDGRLFKGENNEPDIIHVEPLATEGTAEWAWQMLMLGIPVSHPAEGEFQDTYYTKEGFVRCMAKTGWQIYKEKPQPQYTVGDWVEYKGKQYRISAFGGGEMMFFENAIFALTPPYPIRKLDPSEVTVKIGCLEGTVRKDIYGKFKMVHPSNYASLIPLSALDIPTRELVKSLLKAQGGAE